MRRLSVAEVHEQKIAELGLDPSALDLTSIEAIAGALRRAAGFLCPCVSPTLIRGVVQPLRGLVDDLQTVKVLVEDTLDAMIAHGDILEHHEMIDSPGHRISTLLYPAPAAFITRESGTVILLGIASDQLSALPEELEARVDYLNHLRQLSPTPGENLRDELVQIGLIELAYADWLKMPSIETAEQHLSKLDRLLDAVHPSRDVPGLVLLDSERPVRYYRGRWVEPHSQSGRFVARRSQAYGAQLWCYVQLRNGNPERLIDLPMIGSRWRGCDEAWLLQLAIDATRGTPQQFRVRPGPERTAVMEFFSPLPMWAQRRWDAIGEPATISGCLFAYRLRETELAEEIRFAREKLFLDEIAASEKQP
jgi:hypothetical protein